LFLKLGFKNFQVLLIGDLTINEGEWISMNGSTGEVILGKQALAPPALSPDLETFMSWADAIRRLKVFMSFCSFNLFDIFKLSNSNVR